MSGFPFSAIVGQEEMKLALRAMFNHRLRQPFGRALIIAGLCALVGLSMLVMSSQSSADWAVYSFVGGLMIWA